MSAACNASGVGLGKVEPMADADDNNTNTAQEEIDEHSNVSSNNELAQHQSSEENNTHTNERPMPG